MVRRAFSTIEMLVVITIIAVLAGLLVASARAFGIGSRRTKSVSILAVVRTGLELVAANQGSRPSPCEHPLAASKDPRPTFTRAPRSPVAVTACITTGMALRGIPADQVMSALSGGRGLVLLDDDRFADSAAPQYFGVERGRMGILGAGVAAVTAYRKLPPSFTGDPTAPANSAVGVSVAPDGVAADHGAVIDQVFAIAGIASELVSLGGLRAPPVAFIHPITSSPVNSRLVSDIAATATGADRWKPGLIRDGALGWKTSAIPGSILVDAWGREILYSLAANGAIILESAGADGCFRFAPGPDGTLDTTDPFASAPANQDRDGTRDNLASRPGG